MKKNIRKILKKSMTFQTPFDDNTMIFENGLIDSMGLIHVIDFIEQEFNIMLSDVDLQVENFASVNAIEKFLEKKSI